VAGADGSRNFVFRCRNPRCRAEYLMELSIAGALAALPRRMPPEKRPALGRVEDSPDGE
jgi:hypothetical protein